MSLLLRKDELHMDPELRKTYYGAILVLLDCLGSYRQSDSGRCKEAEKALQDT